MSEIRQISFVLGSLFLIFWGMNALYSRLFFEKDLHQLGGVWEQPEPIRSDTEILFLGDQSNLPGNEGELDRRPISAMVDDLLPSVPMDDLTSQQAHAGIFSVLLSRIPVPNKVKRIVIPVNLESFSAESKKDPLETDFARYKTLRGPFPPLFSRFITVLRSGKSRVTDKGPAFWKKVWKREKLTGLPYSDVREWDRAMMLEGVRKPDGSYDATRTAKACHYIKSFAYTLDTSSDIRLGQFNQLLHECRERNWEPVVLFLPVNLEEGKELAGQDLAGLMLRNRDILIHWFTQRGVAVLDYSAILPTGQFVDANQPEERYDEMGRKSMAWNLAGYLAPGEREKGTSESAFKQPAQFADGCEYPYGWPPESTCTGAKSWAGRRSSLVFSPQPYSMTFDYPLARIRPEDRDAVAVHFVYWCEEPIPQARLVIDIRSAGAKEPVLWNAIDLPGGEDAGGGWKRVSYRYNDTDLLSDPDNRIRIYVYNPGAEKLYIDDFNVSFGL